MYTQRKKERRIVSRKTAFPLVTDTGFFVDKDRRSIPDRRLGDIHQELTDAANHCFADSPFASFGNKDY